MEFPEQQRVPQESCCALGRRGRASLR